MEVFKMKNVKDLIYSGLYQGWSRNNIISQIMYKIATNEEIEYLGYWIDLPELKEKAEQLFNKYSKEYYKPLKPF